MEIKINGEKKEIDAEITIEQLLAQLGIENCNLAIEYNGDFIEGDSLVQHTLKPGDTLEIVRFVGGG